MNATSAITRGARLFPDKTALVFETLSYSYRQLDAAIDGVAARLAQLGIGRGERVALLFPNHPHFIFCCYAVQRLGAIAAILAPATPPTLLAAQLADCGARVLLTDLELAGTLAREALDPLLQIRAVTVDWERPAPAAPVAVPPETPAVILYTSGTTGGQKGVTLSHGALEFNHRASVDALRLVPDDRFLGVVPLCHSFGLTAVMGTAFEACATLVLQPGFEAAAAAAAIAAHRITVLPAVPPVFRILLDTAAPAQLASLRSCLSAAIALPTATAEGWSRRFGCIINEGYGTTETSLVCFNHRLQYRPGSVGTPLTGVEVAVCAEDGRRLPPLEVGEVQIRAGSLMLGYWGRDEATAAALRDGWYRSGDLGYLDADGYLFLTDRQVDVINSGGRKVFPSAVEAVLRAFPGVQEAAVFAGSNPLLGEDVRAAVVLAPRGPWCPEILDALAAHCRDRLPDWQQPRSFHLLAELPKAPSGKVLKRELRERAEAGELGRAADPAVAAAPAPTPADDGSRAAPDLAEVIAAVLTQVLGARPDPDAELRAQGLDSLKATALAAALEALLGRPLPVTIAFQHPTLAALQRHLIPGGGAAADAGADAGSGESLTALSDAALAAAPEIDFYARLTFVHTPYLNTSVAPEHRSEIICTDRHGFRVSHDSAGLVDSDTWPARPRRALALGNSFMFGWGASGDAATIPSLLGARTRWSFLNAATAGANSFQEVVSAAPFIRDAELILIGGGLSNLLRALEYEPYNDLYGGLVGREFWAFVRQLDFRYVLDLLGQAPDPGSPLSAGRQAAEEALRQAMAEHAEGFARWRREGWSPTEVARRYERALAHLRRDLELLVRAKSPGARIVYAMQPTATLAKPDPTPEERGLMAVHQHYNTMWKQVFEPYVAGLLPDFMAAVAQSCAALGVPYVDLNRLDYAGWCFCDQGHLNDRGNRIVADFLAEWIDAQ